MLTEDRRIEDAIITAMRSFRCILPQTEGLPEIAEDIIEESIDRFTELGILPEEYIQCQKSSS